MSSLQKTPTKSATLAPNVNLHQAASDSDIPHTVCDETLGHVNITTRYKRPRPDDGSSPTKNQFEDFKHEISQMLTSLKNEQETFFTKLMNEQNATLSKVMSELADLKLQNIEIQKSNKEIEKSIIFLNEKYDDIIKQIEDIQKDKQAHRDSVLLLEAKTQDLQQLSRSSSIEVRNVPQLTENESASSLTEVISKVGSVCNMDVNKSHIRDIRRLPGKPGISRPIVTEFYSVQTKDQFLTLAKEYNQKCSKEERLNSQKVGLPGDRRPIYVAEYLPMNLRKLLLAAKEYAKINNYKFCWTKNGLVFLRKIEGAKHILIKSEQTLRDLATPQ